jgi:ribosomal protein S18 acetylase RimI-like enzyme
MKIRPVRSTDLDDVMRVEKSAWPLEIRASREQLIERYHVYPQGFLVAENQRKVIGILTSQRVDYQIGESPDGWEKTTNHGWIRTTHKAHGMALYVVSLGVDIKWQHNGVGSALIRAIQEHARVLDLAYVLLDSRIPNYKLFYEKGMPVEAYALSANKNGERIDPELRFYERLGFQILSPSQIIPSCMAHDSESLNYGVRMIWSR